VTAGERSAAVLWPLLAFAGGVLAGAAPALHWSATPHPAAAATALAGAGLLAVGFGLVRPEGRTRMLLAAGLALGFASGTVHTARRARLVRAVPGGTVLRIRAVPIEGWTPSRWGVATRARVEDARAGSRTVRLPSPLRLELRGRVPPGTLPPPGTTVEALVRIRHVDRPGGRSVLVAKSARLLRAAGPPGGLPGLRQRLANRLFEAAGTSAAAIRAAELDAALALGRRDLLPAGTVERWRASGLAHVLAVSGLHVGIVAGLAWLVGTAAGLAPGPRRLAVMALMPAYALLAGASPSAIRATAMIEIYLLARLLGRHVIPLGAVALAATVMVLAAPSLLLRPGFQLTVLVTAAILRWAPPLARRLPLPETAATAVAVPVVAQLAAMPLTGWWFGRVVPAGIVTNLAGLALLPVLIVAALAATGLAAILPPLAAIPIAVTGAASRLLVAAGTPARAHAVPLPHPPAAVTALGLVLALLAILPGRTGRRALGGALVAGVLLLLLPASHRNHAPVTLLPVDDGAAVLIDLPDGPILLDGGRRPLEADRLLRDAGVGPLQAVVASHTDEDHAGGIPAVLRDHPAGLLLLPRWMASSPQAVPLLRAARHRDTRVVPLVRGVAVAIGTTHLETLWPPATPPPGGSGNDRSLVLQLRAADCTALLPGDTTRRVEPRYATAVASGGLLVVPHHGSRSSCSSLLLARVAPQAALIPAAPGTPYHHPAPETLSRLRRAGIPFHVARWTPWCGATPDAAGRWRLEP